MRSQGTFVAAGALLMTAMLLGPMHAGAVEPPGALDPQVGDAVGWWEVGAVAGGARGYATDGDRMVKVAGTTVEVYERGLDALASEAEGVRVGPWRLVASLSPSGGTDYGGFAALSNVAIDGDRIAVGAYLEKDEVEKWSGAVYVFERQDDGTWAQAARLVTTDTRGHLFGASVDVDGDTLVAGAYYYKVKPGVRQGAAYVFERDGDSGAWELTQRLRPRDIQNYDLFGISSAVEGDTVLVGSRFGSSINEFTRQDDGSWLETGHIKAHIAWNTFLVDGVVAFTKNHGAYREPGQVSIYAKDEAGAWVQEAYFTGDQGFGADIAFDGTRLIIGGPRMDALVVARDLVTDAWEEEAVLDVPGTFSVPVGVAGHSAFASTRAFECGVPLANDVAPVCGAAMPEA